MHRPPGFYGNRPRNPNNFQWNPRGGPRQRFQTPGFRGANNYSEEHWCETCDRGFPTFATLENHKQQHQKCNIDGCQFVAHPKVITKHIQMQHSTGLFKKIANLNNPDDVIKWREERKKKYPTKQNVEKKEAQIKEKIERGEKMGLKNNRHNRTEQKQDMQTKRKHPFANENSFEKRKKQQQNHSNPNERKSLPAKKPEKALPVMQDHRKLKPFAGIQDLVMDFSIDVEDNVEEHSSLIDDDDYDNEPPKTTNPPPVSEPTVCGALSSLICNYESSDEELDTKNIQSTKKTELINQKTVVNSQVDTKVTQNNSCQDQESMLKNNNINTSTADNVINEDDGPEEVKFDKKVDTEIGTVPEQAVKTKQTSVKRNDTVDRHKKFNQNRRSKLPSTLLQKLLHKEIRQERNIVLQCIRHIVKSNYFGKI